MNLLFKKLSINLIFFPLAAFGGDISCYYNVEAVNSQKKSNEVIAKGWADDEKIVRLNGNQWKTCTISKPYVSNFAFGELSKNYVGIAAVCADKNNQAIASHVSLEMDTTENFKSDTTFFQIIDSLVKYDGRSNVSMVTPNSKSFNIYLSCTNCNDSECKKLTKGE